MKWPRLVQFEVAAGASGDAPHVSRALTNLVELCRGVDRKIVITCYNVPDRLLCEALDISPDEAVAVPDFTEAEIAAVLLERGAPPDIVPRLARAALIHTSGHPTLVDVHCEALRLRNFPSPSATSLLDTPMEVSNEQERVRLFVGSLPSDEQSLLYRASLLSRPALRDQIIYAASKPIPPEGSITYPGALLDRFVGPWLEIDPVETNRLRVSPLLRNAGVKSTDPVWLRAAHRVLAQALLSVNPVDVRDGIAALTHGITGEDHAVIFQVLSSLWTANRAHLTMLAKMSPVLGYIGIGVKPIPALQDPGIATMLRTLQYRLASITRDQRLAAQIVEHFEQETEGSELSDLWDVMFYGTAITYPAESGAEMMRHAVRFIALGEKALPGADDKLRDAFEQLIRDSEYDDLTSALGAAVFSTVSSRVDLHAVLAECETRGVEFTRRFNAALDEDTVGWRGVAATLIINERDSEAPDLLGLVADLKRFSRVLREVGLTRLAVDVVASAATIVAEHLGNTAEADALLDESEADFGATPRFGRARALVRHASGEWAEALRIFEISFQELERDVEDPELPMDMRLAAHAAGMIGRFGIAAHLLERASSLLVSERQPSMAAGLAMDAAYASWRGDNGHEALRLALRSLQMLDEINLPAEDQRVQNTLRRSLYVLLLMSERRETTLNGDNLLPVIGFASNPEVLPDQAEVMRIGLLYAVAGHMELRITGDTTVVREHFDTMVVADGPALGMAIFLRLNDVSKRGLVHDTIPLLAGMLKVNATLRERFPDRENDVLPVVRGYLALSLLAYSVDNELNTQFLQNIATALDGAELLELSAWIKTGVALLGDPEQAIKVLRGGGRGRDERLIAAIVVSVMRDVSGEALFLSQQAQVALLGIGDGQMPVIEIVLRASKRLWLDSIDVDALFPTGNMRGREQLRAAITSATGTPRSQLLAIFRAASEATLSRLHEPVEGLLASEGS